LFKASIAGFLRSHPLACFCLVSLCWTAFLYRHAYSGAFLYDDAPQIQNNPALLSWQSTFGYFRSAIPFSNDYLTSGGTFYRPILWLSLAVDRRLWGLNPAGFHLANVVLHWINGLLLFLLTRRTRTSLWVCAASCFIWLGLPITSEAVAWISGRYIAIFAFFVLLSLLLADEFFRSKSIFAFVGWLLLSLTAILSYEAGALVLPLSLLWAYFWNERASRSWLPLCLGGAVVYGIDFGLRQLVHAQLPTGSGAILPAGAAFFKYIQWMIAPIRMSVERSTDLPSDSFSFANALGLVGVISLIIAGLHFRKKFPEVAFGLGWLLITLLPFCGIFPNYQGMAERYEYLPAIGFSGFVAAVAYRLRGVWHLVAIGIVILWVCWGAWRLNARVLDWKDELSVDLASLEATPNSPVLLYNVGVAEAEQGHMDNAAAYYRRAISENPRYVSARLNLGNVLRQQGQYSAAIVEYQGVIALEPKNPAAWMNLGNVYQQLGSLKGAKTAYESAVAADPRSSSAVINLGTVLQRLGDLPHAQLQYEEAIRLSPAQPAAYCDLGILLFQRGEIESAVRTLNKAIEIDPSNDQAYLDLAIIYQHEHRYALAAEMYRLRTVHQR
jgi:protein O-mannosyl-transferase